jgi:hypothetical protein
LGVFFSDNLRTKFLYLISIGLHGFSSRSGCIRKATSKAASL